MIAISIAPGVASSQSAATSIAQLRTEIEQRIAADAGAVAGVVYSDLETGERLSLAADTVFHAASTMKVPVMIEVLRRSEQGAFSLDQGILLTNRFRSL